MDDWTVILSEMRENLQGLLGIGEYIQILCLNKLCWQLRLSLWSMDTSERYNFIIQSHPLGDRMRIARDLFLGNVPNWYTNKLLKGLSALSEECKQKLLGLHGLRMSSKLRLDAMGWKKRTELLICPMGSLHFETVGPTAYRRIIKSRKYQEDPPDLTEEIRQMLELRSKDSFSDWLFSYVAMAGMCMSDFKTFRDSLYFPTEVTANDAIEDNLPSHLYWAYTREEALFYTYIHERIQRSPPNEILSRVMETMKNDYDIVMILR